MTTASSDTEVAEGEEAPQEGGPVESQAAEQGKPGVLSVVLALLSLYLIWGSTYLAIRIALEGFPPFLMAGGRYLVPGAIMYLFLRVRGRPNPSGRQWLAMLAIGTLLLVGGNGGVTYAEQWVSSSLAAVWIGSMPIWAALFAGLFGKWPTGLEWLGLALGFGGVALLNMEGNLQANPVGAVALLVATITWAFGSVWSQHLPLPSGLMSSAGEMLAGGGVLLLLSFALGEPIPRDPSPASIWAVVYLIFFGSIVAFSAYVYLLKHVRPTIATSYAYVNPVVAVALGVGFAGEHVSVVGLAAMAVILAAVALVALSRGRGTGPGRRS